MRSLVRNFWCDEKGVIISAELVLVMTICVIGVTVGLSEVAHAVVQELNDVGDAIGSLNQSFGFSGFHGMKGVGGWGGGWGGGFGWGGMGVKAWTPGSAFIDFADTCDNNQCTIACDFPTPEAVPVVVW
ncbi:MAG: hypothetical protein HY290_31980 [Planctomycetia bacterium]|nr:hypothetical protein [Planctomycetia bacterium]